MSDLRSLLLVTLVSLGGCKAFKQIASTETPEDPATVLSDAVARIGLGLSRVDVIHAGDDTFPLAKGIRAVSAERLLTDL